MIVQDKDHGYKELMHQVQALRDAKVSVGISEEDGTKPYERGATLIDIAVWNEFGTKSAPARSFIRAWFDGHQPEIKTALKKLLTLVIKRELTREEAVNIFGLWAVGEIRKRIEAGIPPPNAPFTIEKKGSDTPLIETETLINSISHRIDNGKAIGDSISLVRRSKNLGL